MESARALGDHLTVTVSSDNFNSQKLIISSGSYGCRSRPESFLAPNGQIIMSSFAWRPIFPGQDSSQMDGIHNEISIDSKCLIWGAFTSTSEDGGKSWDKRTYLDQIEGFPELVKNHRGWLGGRHRGQLVCLENGDLLMPTYDRVRAGEPFRSFVYKSRDNGKSWSYFRSIYSEQVDPNVGLAEPTLFRTNDEALYAFCRTFGAGDQLAIAKSNDDGANWTIDLNTNIIGHPYYVVKVDQNSALLVYAVRAECSSIRARFIDLRNGIISNDELILRDGAPHKDIGYPTPVKFGNGKLFVCYYWIDIHHVRHIEGLTIDFLDA